MKKLVREIKDSISGLVYIQEPTNKEIADKIDEIIDYLNASTDR